MAADHGMIIINGFTLLEKKSDSNLCVHYLKLVYDF